MKRSLEEINVKDAEKLTYETLKTIGKNIKRIRLERQLTQNDVGFLSYMDKSLISSLERGNYQNITLLSINKLLILFDIEINELLKE